MSNKDIYEYYAVYELVKDIPLCKKGTIFYYDPDDSIKGSIGQGCLKMAWTKEGSCQNGLCGDTIIFHARARKDKNWFKKIKDAKPNSNLIRRVAMSEVYDAFGEKVEIIPK